MTATDGRKPIPKIVRAQPKQSGQIATLFADAFADDPTWSAIAPGRRQRHRAVKSSFLTELVRGGHKDVLVALDDSGAVIGALRVMGPEGPSSRRSTWLKAAEAIATRVVPSAKRGAKHDHAVHAKRPDQRHWYFRDLVTAPAAQGHGVGSALFAHALATVDEDPAPVFLESTTEGSKRLYERFGFKHVDTVNVIPGATVFIMVRPPR